MDRFLEALEQFITSIPVSWHNWAFMAMGQTHGRHCKIKWHFHMLCLGVSNYVAVSFSISNVLIQRTYGSCLRTCVDCVHCRNSCHG